MLTKLIWAKSGFFFSHIAGSLPCQGYAGSATIMVDPGPVRSNGEVGCHHIQIDTHTPSHLKAI